MKTETSDVLKYLAGEFSDKEKLSFEKRMENSAELKSLVLSEKKKLDKLNELASVEADNSYFVNLLPRVRERLENRKRKFPIIRYAYAVSIIIIGIFVYHNLNTGADTGYLFLEDEDFTILDQIDEGGKNWIFNSNGDELVSNFYINDLYDYDINPEEIIVPSVLNEDNDKTNYDVNILNGYDSNITDTEAEDLYQYLLNKNLIQEK